MASDRSEVPETSPASLAYINFPFLRCPQDHRTRCTVLVQITLRYITITIALAGFPWTHAAQAAQAGLGIAMLPVHIARASSHLASGLAQVLPEWEGAPALSFAITARDNRLARVVALLDWVRTRVPGRLEKLDTVDVCA